MTEKLYDKDSFLREFSAVVIESYPKDGGFVTVLDRTAFFPEGGGQPSDIGMMNDSSVFDVQINDGIIYHKTEKGFLKGETVNCTIDFARRFDFMQQHSGEHVLSGTAHRLYGCENVGFHLSEETVTLNFDRLLSESELLSLENDANEAVFENHGIVTYYPEKEELKRLKYRSKKEIIGDVRIVEIMGVDICACCAPHVHTTGEIGLIKLIRHEKIRGGTRLEIKCGRRALEDYRQKNDSIKKISSLLCVKDEETYKAVEKAGEKISELKFKLNGVKSRLMLSAAENADFKRDVTFLFEDDLDMKELQNFASMLYQRYGGVRVILSSAKEGFLFAICGDEEKLNGLFLKLKGRFAVKGGGRGTMLQGTVIAKKQELEDFFLS